MMNKILDKIGDKIEGFGEGIESAIWGKKDYNLEINLSKIFREENAKKLEKIAEYTGSFIVTERGYLLGGHDGRLEKKYAAICNAEKLPPTIIYENGNINEIVRDILGLRLASLIPTTVYEKEPQLNSSLSFA